MSINRGVDPEDVVHIHNGILEEKERTGTMFKIIMTENFPPI